MAQSRHVHWLAPTIMSASLLLGALFALVHHLLYSSLAGKEASNSYYSVLSFSISRQQVNTSAGTAFAFLTTSLLMAAVSTAYDQLLWHAISKKDKAPTLSDLDVAFAGCYNAVGLFWVPVWVRYPLLFSVALLTVLVPIAAVVTPGTLSVDVVPSPPKIRHYHVPTFQSMNLAFLAPMDAAEKDPNPFKIARYGYHGPSDALRRIATAAAAEGRIILPPAPPGVNTSWVLDVAGPSVSCSNISDPELSAIQQNILAQTHPMVTHFSLHYYTFLAWTPQRTPNGMLTYLPFVPHENNGSRELSADSMAGAGGNASIFLAVMPNASDTFIAPHQDGRALFEKATFLRCQLYNRTYNMRFNYTDTAQRLDVDVSPSEEQPLSVLDSVFASSKPHCTTLDVENVTGCGVDPVVVQRLSYQAIMDAFNMLFTGSIRMTNNFGLTLNTNIAITPLLKTQELRYVEKAVSYSDGTLQSAVGLSTSLAISELAWYIPPHGQSDPSLATALEELFRNITISTMSSAALRPYPRSHYWPKPVNVTHHLWGPSYVYAADRLWLAYGLALLFTSGAVALGVAALLSNGASYSNNFTTVLRATHQATMSVTMLEKDADPADPLPDYLAKAQITLVSRPRRLLRESGDYVEVKQLVKMGMSEDRDSR